MATRQRIGRYGLVIGGSVSLLVAGAGPGFAAGVRSTAVHAAGGTHAAASVHAAQASGVTDPSGDTVNGNGQPVAQPKADILSAGISNTGTTITATASVTTYSDPATDPAWKNLGTGIDWAIDLTKPGSDEYDIVLGPQNQGDAPSVTIYDNRSTTAPVVCTGQGLFTPNPTSNTYQVTIPASCIGSPGYFRWAVAMAYDTVAGDGADLQGAVDIAPDSAALTPAAGEPTVVAGGANSLPTQGYWIFAADGQVFNHGAAQWYGSAASLKLNQPIITGVATASGQGYYLVGRDGGIFTYGDAKFFGSEGGKRLNAPIVSMIPTPTGQGYWLIGADGGIFTFGDAQFYGSEGGKRLNGPVLAGAASATGKGYWLVGTDGGVFSFGDAVFHGSEGAVKLNKPVTGITRSAGGAGYLLAAADGGVFTFGDATFHGSAGALKLNAPVIGLVKTPSGNGYRLVATDGGSFQYGDAEYDGSEGNSGLGNIFVGEASAGALPA